MRRRMLAGLLTFTATLILFAGAGFLLTLGLVDAGNMDNPSRMTLWFDELSRAAYRDPLSWYGIGSVVVLGSFLLFAALGTRVDRRSESRERA